MNTRSMVSVARPHTCSASRSGVFWISTTTMCHSPAHDRGNDQRQPTTRSSDRFGLAESRTSGSSVRFTARLVNMTAAWNASVAAWIERERRIMVSAQESGTCCARLLLDAEAVHPCHQGPEQQLIV